MGVHVFPHPKAPSHLPPHPESHSHLPPHPTPLGHSSAAALSTLYHALNQAVNAGEGVEKRESSYTGKVGILILGGNAN